MKVLITGICGFAGSTLALKLREAGKAEVQGVDNFIRPGSELNRRKLQTKGIIVRHADLRVAEDVEALPDSDWLIDAAANPSVLAGTSGSSTSSRALMQHNLTGTIQMLEYCRARKAGFILLSTSRVYSIAPLAALELEVREQAFQPRKNQTWPAGVTGAGVSEDFSTTPPVSLYGVSKVCSENLALEYSQVFGFPVWINRLGVLAGAGQFGRADQGIFSFWLHSCAARRPLRFIGFGGEGHQVRDCLHPADLTEVLLQQMKSKPATGQEITNFSGGIGTSMSLRQLHSWCEQRFGSRSVEKEAGNRTFDVPWMVLDSTRAKQRFGWRPKTSLPEILEEIACHADANPQWLDWTAGG